MAEHEVERRSDDGGRPRGALLLGPGRRAREVGAVLAALAALPEDGADDGEDERKGEPRREAPAQVRLKDLEELLAKRPGPAGHELEGLLILESGRVPAEDIGFVRRFLERHPLWRLVVIAEDAQDASARALLALGRSRWLRWPPDLAALRAVLASQAPQQASQPSAPERGAKAAAPSAERASPRKPARRPAASNGAVDLGELLEELLAGAALVGDTLPRYQLHARETVILQRERAPLSEGLGGLVELARVSAGADGLVSVGLAPSADAIVIELEFPRGGLPEKELATLLEQAPAGRGAALAGPDAVLAKLDAALARGLTSARQGCELLRAAGARVELASSDPGRVRCEVRFSVPRAPQGKAPPRAARAGKAEDPFA